MTEKICKTCAYWEPPQRGDFGECTEFSFLDRDGATPETLAFVSCAECYGNLLTKAVFSCVLWTIRKESPS